MKKLFFAAAIFSALLATSCSEGGNEPQESSVMMITENTTWNAADPINKTVVVTNGATLTFTAGSTINVAPGFANYILVDRGAKIMAVGTASAPITFTSEGTDRWGGLIINGNAAISCADASSTNEANYTGTTEINNDYLYGGKDNSDNSGQLSYVKLINTGARSSADVEHNGLTLNAVGSGTTINNIYVDNAADDAIEFFGGCVDVTNLLVVDSDDDMFDITQGYTGTITNCYGVWTSGFTSSEGDPRGVESDGNLDGDFPDYALQSDYTINGMTIENNCTTDTYMHDAIKVRRGATATITNALVMGAGVVKDLVDITDNAGAANSATTINVTNSLTTALTGDAINSGTATASVVVVAGNVGASTTVFGWTGYAF